MSTSVVMRKDRVLLPFRTGLQGEKKSKRSKGQLDCPLHGTNEGIHGMCDRACVTYAAHVPV